MRRSTITLILFIIIAAGIIGVSMLLRNQPPIEITVVVNPLAEDWIRQAVNDFNESKPIVNGTQRVQVNLLVIGDMDVWENEPGWTPEDHPAAWIPSSAASVEYAPGNFGVTRSSLARTLLVWGGYASRVDVLSQDGDALDWGTVAAAAQTESWDELGGEANWNYLKLAFALPDSSMSGLAVLFSGAAAFNETATLNQSLISSSEFAAWMRPVVGSVPNFQTLGGDVARAVGRGPSTVEIALLPESQWLQNLEGMLNHEAIRFNYPEYQFIFDFPLAMWVSPDSPLTDNERATVESLGDWLLGEEMQNTVSGFGLRPVESEPTAADSLFAEALPYGIELMPDYGQIVQPPSRSAVESLIARFDELFSR